MIFSKKNKQERPIIFVITADGHVNSMAGLCPRGPVDLDDGGQYLPSREQLWIWSKWKDDFWQRIGDLKRDLRAEVWWANAGDGADDNYHSKYGLISMNKSIIVRLAVESFSPAIEVSDRRFFVRGTPAHVGQDAELEELIAMECDAEMWRNSYTRWAWKVQAHSTTFFIRHKPVSNSTRLHTRGGGANRCAVQMVMEAANTNRELPDVALFGHYHHPEDSGDNYNVRVFFLPCWKLHGSYDKYMGFSVEPIGGRVIICYPDRYDVLPLKDWSYLPGEEKVWTAM